MKRLAFLLALLLARVSFGAAIPVLENSVYLSVPGNGTTSTSFVVDDAHGVGPLVSGRKYLVFARNVFDGDSNSAVTETAVDLGTGSTAGTTVALAAGEGTGSSSFTGTGQLQTLFVITGDGTNSLRFKHRCVTSGDTCFMNDEELIAIPLNDPVTNLVENTDWFYNGTTGATAEVSNVSTTWTTARTVDFTLPGPTQDYLVCGSVELDPDSTSTSDSADSRFQVDATTQISEWVQEDEDDRDQYDDALCIKKTLTAGSHTFRWQIHNRNASAVVDAYRANIAVLRLKAFSQFGYTEGTTGRTYTNTLYNDDNADYLEAQYLPLGMQHSRIALGTVRLGYSSAGIATAMIFASDGIGDPDATFNRRFAGRGMNDIGGDSGDDVVPTLLMRLDSIIPNDGDPLGLGDARYNFGIRTRLQSASGTGSICKNAAVTADLSGCNLMLLGLDVPIMDPILGNAPGRVMPTTR